MEKRILIACPTFEGMEYCFMDFLFGIKNLNSIEGYSKDILIVDNSKTTNFMDKYIKMPGFKEIKFIHDKENKEEKNMLRVVHSRNFIIDYAARKNYDYIFMLDSDVILPNDILDKLIQSGKDVISGLYFGLWPVGRYLSVPENERNNPIALPVAYRELTEEEFQIYKETHPDFTDKSQVKVHLSTSEVKSGKTFEVRVPSPGCMLISRKAFTSGAKYGILKEGGADDGKFIKDLISKGFKIYCDTSCLCKHDVFGKFTNNDGMHPAYQ